MSNNSPRYRRKTSFPRMHGWNYVNRFLARLVTKFTGTASNFAITATVASNGFTITGHSRLVGDGPLRLNAGSTGTVAAAMNTTTDYYVSAVVDANTVRLSDRFDLSVDVTVAAGAGTGTLVRDITARGIFQTIRRKGLAPVNNATDIDNV